MATDSRSSDREKLYSQIEDEYGSVVYSQVAQEELRSRLSKQERRIKVLQIVLSALSSGGLLGVLFVNYVWLTASTAMVSFLLLILNSYSFRLEINTRVSRHQKAANQLWLLTRKYLSLLTDFDDLDAQEIRNRRNVLIAETAETYSEIDRTDDKSFARAQKRLKEDGLKEFSRDELNKLLPQSLQRPS